MDLDDILGDDEGTDIFDQLSAGQETAEEKTNPNETPESVQDFGEEDGDLIVHIPKRRARAKTIMDLVRSNVRYGDDVEGLPEKPKHVSQCPPVTGPMGARRRKVARVDQEEEDAAYADLLGIEDGEDNQDGFAGHEFHGMDGGDDLMGWDEDLNFSGMGCGDADDRSTFDDILLGRETLESGSKVAPFAGAYKYTKPDKWEPAQEKEFFQAIRLIGPDLMLIHAHLRGWTYDQVRRKFRYEERHDPDFIMKALRDQLPLTIRPYEKLYGKIDPDTHYRPKNDSHLNQGFGGGSWNSGAGSMATADSVDNFDLSAFLENM